MIMAPTVIIHEAILSQQDADAKGCRSNSVAVNASLGRCIKSDIQTADVEEEED